MLAPKPEKGKVGCAAAGEVKGGAEQNRTAETMCASKTRKEEPSSGTQLEGDSKKQPSSLGRSRLKLVRGLSDGG